MKSPRIIIDADACPRNCLAAARRLAEEFGCEMITIASTNHRIDSPNHLVVGNESQATDLAVVQRVGPWDIVVTQDWGLAAMVLAKLGRAIAPSGMEYLNERIDWMLEERNILARERRGGVRTKGPARRTVADDLRFAERLREMLAQKPPDDTIFPKRDLPPDTEQDEETDRKSGI